MSCLQPLLVVAGPTASGKTGLAIELALRLGGEIVSADAVAVYRGLDIGSAKPDASQCALVPHHLLDVADPRDRYSAGDFARDAAWAIDDIVRRSKVPIVTGGSHFYIRALLLGLFAAPPRDPIRRRTFEEQWRQDPLAVWSRLARVDPEAAERIGRTDRQRILRALEVWEVTGIPLSTHWMQDRGTARYRPIIVAPNREREPLYARINLRVDTMFASGLVEEVRQLLASGVPPDAHALKAIGYRQVVAIEQGSSDLQTAIADTKRASRRLAKRQLTWLRNLREGRLHWVAPERDGGIREVLALWDEHGKGSGER